MILTRKKKGKNISLTLPGRWVGLTGILAAVRRKERMMEREEVRDTAGKARKR